MELCLGQFGPKIAKISEIELYQAFWLLLVFWIIRSMFHFFFFCHTMTTQNYSTTLNTFKGQPGGLQDHQGSRFVIVHYPQAKSIDNTYTEMFSCNYILF